MKKYHPDKYNDNPLKDLADVKMSEINEAYDYIIKSKSSKSNNPYSRGEYSDNNSRSGYSAFQNVRDYISKNDLSNAENELNRSNEKSAEWFFLRGVISMRKGWYSQGYGDLQSAVNMDPSNSEYKDALNKSSNGNKQYMNNPFSSRGMANDNMCNNLSCLCCADQLCECMGGDLCSCC